MSVDIAPFKLTDLDGTFCLTLEVGDGYMEDIFAEREDEGMLPNGYGWEALALAYIESSCPHLEEALDFDSEADAFVVYCEDKEPLTEFAEGFKATCEDRERILEILRNADPDIF